MPPNGWGGWRHRAAPRNRANPQFSAEPRLKLNAPWANEKPIQTQPHGFLTQPCSFVTSQGRARFFLIAPVEAAFHAQAKASDGLPPFKALRRRATAPARSSA